MKPIDRPPRKGDDEDTETYIERLLDYLDRLYEALKEDM